MTIRAIDMQVLIPRATDVSKNQQVADHQTSLQQQQSAEQMQKAVVQRQHQVQKTPKDEGGKVRREKDSPEKRKQQQDFQQGDSTDTGAEQSETVKKDGKLSREKTAARTDQHVGHVIDIKT